MSHTRVYVIFSRFDRELVLGMMETGANRSKQKTETMQSERMGGCALILNIMESHKPINTAQINVFRLRCWYAKIFSSNRDFNAVFLNLPSTHIKYGTGKHSSTICTLTYK